MILKYSLAAAAILAMATPTFAQQAAEPLDCSDEANAQEDECLVLLPPLDGVTNFAPLIGPLIAGAAGVGALAAVAGAGGDNSSTPSTNN